MGRVEGVIREGRELREENIYNYHREMSGRIEKVKGAEGGSRKGNERGEKATKENGKRRESRGSITFAKKANSTTRINLSCCIIPNTFTDF